MGNEYVFQILATGNVEDVDRYGMGEPTRSPDARPHCFNTIGNEYGQLRRVPGGAPFDWHPRRLVGGRLVPVSDGLPGVEFEFGSRSNWVLC